MHTKVQAKDQVIFIKRDSETVRREKLICKALIKAQLILYELIPQISLLWNYENYLHAY